MPELPEVETVRRGLAPVLEGRRLAAVVCRRPDLRFPLPRDFARRLAGVRVDAIDRRGKFLLFRLDDGNVLIAHLGMSGRFQVAAGDAPEPGVHDHVVLTTEAGVTVRFRDPRRFGFMDLVPAAELDAYPMLARLGIEPLSAGFSGAWLQRRLAGRTMPIKSAVLDQSIVAGIGNIYACESLYRAGLSPTRLAGTIVGRRAGRLVKAIKTVLNEAIAAGGSSLRDHRAPAGELGTFQHGFAVYGREGRECPTCTCGGADPGEAGVTGGVRRIVQAGRSTFYCAKQQR